MARKKTSPDRSGHPRDDSAAGTASPRRPLYPRASLQGLVLRQLDFRLFGNWPEPDSDGLDSQVQFLLSAIRIAPGLLQVEFETKAEKEGIFTVSVAYRMTFLVEVEGGDDERVLFQRVAAHLAPVVAFPYVRETVTSVAARAGAKMPVVLPIMNVGAMFKPETIEISEPPG